MCSLKKSLSLRTYNLTNVSSGFAGSMKKAYPRPVEGDAVMVLFDGLVPL